MVVGYPPFYSDDPKTTCQKILNWKRTFRVPRDANLSKEATDLIYRLVCDKDERLGNGGPAEIKKHAYFQGIDWDNIRNSEAPWMPELDGDCDSRNFDKFDEIDSFYPPTLKKKSQRKDPNFIGFTYKRQNSQRNSLVSALENLESIRITTSKSDLIDDSDDIKSA